MLGRSAPWGAWGFALMAAVVATACSSQEQRTLYLGGIPDQDVSLLEARFDGLARYLTEQTGIPVEYIPSVNYASVVTAFERGDIHLGWYGGLTGVQARRAVPDAQAIAQRPRDQAFRSVFVADPDSGIETLEDLAARSFTFGSESSTSGHLMPRSFLEAAGVDPEADLAGGPHFSGSHDTTWKLVEAGAFDAGALSEAVWQARVDAGEVDLSRVGVFFTTPPYVDYHWVLRGDVDDRFGAGVTARIRDALLAVSVDAGPTERAIAEAFHTDRFVAASNDAYAAIEDIAVELGFVER